VFLRRVGGESGQEGGGGVNFKRPTTQGQTYSDPCNTIESSSTGARKSGAIVAKRCVTAASPRVTALGGGGGGTHHGKAVVGQKRRLALCSQGAPQPPHLRVEYGARLALLPNGAVKLAAGTKVGCHRGLWSTGAGGSKDLRPLPKFVG
jgi:hypothetical protein